MKKVAIAGCGLAGLAAAYHLLQSGKVSVTLYDPKGVGGGASGVSTGLLHPFPGRLALHSWRADEGMHETRALVELVEQETNRNVAHRGGILRLALTDQQKRDFPSCVPFGCEWWPAEKVLEKLPSAKTSPALWIPQGLTVYSRPYLQGLWQLCEKKGAELKLEALPSSEFFDAVLLAMGSDTPKNLCPEISLHVTRGQALWCKWKIPLPFTLLSQGHLTPSEDPSLCQLGSTYENPETPYDISKGWELKQKIAAFYPPAQEFEPVEVKVGCRIGRKNGYRPIISQIDPKTWVFFGLGSRGLLYHSLLAKELAHDLLRNL